MHVLVCFREVSHVWWATCGGPYSDTLLSLPIEFRTPQGVIYDAAQSHDWRNITAFGG
jgi:hypothetical protein